MEEEEIIESKKYDDENRCSITIFNFNLETDPIPKWHVFRG